MHQKGLARSGESQSILFGSVLFNDEPTLQKHHLDDLAEQPCNCQAISHSPSAAFKHIGGGRCYTALVS